MRPSSSTTTGSTLSESGSTDATDSYVLSKTASGYHDATSTGNSEDGEYTLSGNESSTSTAIETNEHGAYSATYTEILGSNDSFSELQDTEANEYSLSESGTNSDNFVDKGTDADGTFLVTEGSAGTFDDSTVGQNDTGEFDATASTGDTYSYTETVTGGATPFSETETGTESAVAVQHENSVLSTYTTLTSGTDLYTLAESGTLTGGTFAETVTGTDNYATTDTGDPAEQSDDSTTTGGGNWTRTSSGPGATLPSDAGTNGYTLVSVGNALLGSFSESETGTDRYGLVQSFDDVANDGAGSTPGNVTFHGNGLPFRDPGSDDSKIANTPTKNAAGGLMDATGKPLKVADSGPMKTITEHIEVGTHQIKIKITFIGSLSEENKKKLLSGIKGAIERIATVNHIINVEGDKLEEYAVSGKEEFTDIQSALDRVLNCKRYYKEEFQKTADSILGGGEIQFFVPGERRVLSGGDVSKASVPVNVITHKARSSEVTIWLDYFDDNDPEYRMDPLNDRPRVIAHELGRAFGGQTWPDNSGHLGDVYMWDAIIKAIYKRVDRIMDK